MKKTVAKNTCLFQGAAICTIVIASISATSIAQAELFERNGMAYINGTVFADVKAVYCDELDITYLDILPVKLSVNDSKIYVESILWIGDNNEKYDDWRLPETLGTELYDFGATASEMGHLYYEELGNVSSLSCMEADETETCVPGLVTRGPFSYLTEDLPYWYGDVENASYLNYAPYFDFAIGFQGEMKKSVSFYILPVRTGDVITDGISDDGDLLIECGYYMYESICVENDCLWNGKKCKKYPNR
jgi:hypothetical protein